MPGPANFNTPISVITTSLRNAGKLDLEADPSPSQLVDGLNRLNTLINYEQTQGLKLFLDQDISIAAPILAAGTALYSLGPTGNVVMTKPLRIVQGYYVDSAANRRPIDPPLSRDEYTRLSTTTIQGTITSYFVDKQVSSLNVYLWNTPDAQAVTGTVHFIVQIQPAQLISLTDTITFPLEWKMYFDWALAQQITIGQPKTIIDRCDQMSAFYREKLEGWDVEDASTVIQPDQRIYQDVGGFR